MLLPDPHALWLLAFLLVVFTRDFHVPFLALFVIFQVVVWMTSSANQLLPLEMYEFEVRRVSFLVYGALAGLSFTFSMGTRVLIPVHTFVKRRLHFAGPASSLAVAYGTYSLATATQLTKRFEPFGDRAPDDPVEIALFSVLFVVCAVLFAAILVLTWLGSTSVLAYHYREPAPEGLTYPPNRIITEFVIALALLVSPHAFWIYLSRPPVSWPQGAAGALTLVVETLLWVGFYFWFQRRFDVRETYFGPSHSDVPWPLFCLLGGGVHILSGLTYLIAAIFLTSGLDTEILLISITLVVVVLSLVFWVLPLSYLRNKPSVPRIVPEPRHSTRSARRAERYVQDLQDRSQRLETLNRA